MVFQSFNLFAHKTILQNVTLGPIKVRKMKQGRGRELAISLLERVGIAEQKDKLPPSCPAVSSSASRSPGRWPCSPR